jgi:hypothetical protein
MYICHIIKTEIGTKSDTKHYIYEKISKSPKNLLINAKKFCRDNYTKFARTKSKFGREYNSKISPWTEISGFKKDTNELYPKHWYKHLVATIIECYGRPSWSIEIQIYRVDEVK